MSKALLLLSRRPYFLLLLPLYFVFHGYIANLEAMTIGEALLLVAQYAFVALLLFGNAFIFLRTQMKAAVFAFTLLFFHLFFGPLHDGWKQLFGANFFTQYSFVLPASAVLIIALFLFLRKSTRKFLRLCAYLNVLLLIILALDVPALIKASQNKTGIAPLAGVMPCDTCNKPDIYFIIADEYADSASLQQIFGYNNGPFLSALRDRNFFIVPQSRSNYNFTPFAMASLFQMNYLEGIEGRNKSLGDKNKCYQWINKASLWHYLQSMGYEIRNHSVFNVANIPTEAPQNYILIGADQVTAHTFLSRLNKDLRYHLSTTFKIQSEVARIAYFINRCNQLLLSRLLEEPKQDEAKPKFVYTHLTMPHYPYYVRSNGAPNPVELLQEGEQVRKDLYVEYLQYCNTIFLQTIDQIQKHSKTPPVIVFMGDHGFREFDDGFEKNAAYYFMNLNTVSIPGGNYKHFYNGISSVNQFRALLNTLFQQKMPMLKDSSSLLYE